MLFHLVSGGCGFIGRNMVRRLYQKGDSTILFVDNLLVGKHPSEWLELPLVETKFNLEIYGSERRLLFLQTDFRDFTRQMLINPSLLRQKYHLPFQGFHDIYHFAAYVGGRMSIENDPLSIAQNLSIDADFFYWISKQVPKRILYPSSSAAYPIDLQKEATATALKEEDIDFNQLRKPDLLYGWTKLTGEYLAQLAAKHYGISIACVRPFSGYGEDQDLNYPIPAIVNRFVNKEDPLIVWGSGEQSRDFVYIEDILDAMELAIDRVTDGSAINIGSGQAVSFLNIIQVLSKITGHHPYIQPQLKKPIGVFSRFGNSKFATNKLSWNPKVSLEEGLRRVHSHITRLSF